MEIIKKLKINEDDNKHKTRQPTINKDNTQHKTMQLTINEDSNYN